MLELASRFPLLDINDAVIEAVEAYISNRIMPNDPGGDAFHLAVASFHRCDFLVTWNCQHIANANEFGHIRRVNGILGANVADDVVRIGPCKILGVPTSTPLVRQPGCLSRYPPHIAQ